MSTLYIVATPIGNLEDVTLRALRILKEADVVFAEDTRVTAKLFARHEIHTKLHAYHQQSSEAIATKIIAMLEDGKTLALVTDAGTPGIADPGNELIARIARESPETRIEPIPGPSSLTAALSVCGFPTNEFAFLGFLPHKKGRMTALNNIQETVETIVLFESPHRIAKLLGELALRVPDRRAAIFRELTKIHESSYRGTVAELKVCFDSGNIPARGEFVVVLAPARMR
jgi:16S rRNA (cytidine1402-2'-O)-methyltransferase